MKNTIPTNKTPVFVVAKPDQFLPKRWQYFQGEQWGFGSRSWWANYWFTEAEAQTEAQKHNGATVQQFAKGWMEF